MAASQVDPRSAVGVMVPLSQVALRSGQAFDFGGERADFAKAVGYMSESLSMAVIFLRSSLASQFGSFLTPPAKRSGLAKKRWWTRASCACAPSS